MTTAKISADLRQLVSDRAHGRCEYCLLHQNFSIYTHEVDHPANVEQESDRPLIQSGSKLD